MTVKISAGLDGWSYSYPSSQWRYHVERFLTLPTPSKIHSVRSIPRNLTLILSLIPPALQCSTLQIQIPALAACVCMCMAAVRSLATASATASSLARILRLESMRLAFICSMYVACNAPS